MSMFEMAVIVLVFQNLVLALANSKLQRLYHDASDRITRLERRS